MGNMSSSDNMIESWSSKYQKIGTENKIHVSFDTSKPALNLSILKAVSLIFLKSYSEESRLSDYYSSLKKFVEKYDYNRFGEFLANFEYFTSVEDTKDCISPTIQPETATSPQRSWLRDPQLIASRKSHEHSRRQTHQPHFYIDESPMLEAKNHEKIFVFTLKVLKFFEVEVAHEQNFFFELVKVFSSLFIKKHKKSTKYLKAQFNRPDLTEKQKQKLNKTAQQKYAEAKADLQQFQNILLNTLKSFITQMQTNVVQKVSFLISPQNLENLSLKLLFRKNKCYKTYFKLINYKVWDDEALLTKCLASLKFSTPEDFKIDPALRLKGEEEPYQKVIDSLDYLEVLTTPFDKFKAILELRKEILKTVQSYYKRCGLCESKIPELTARNLIPIYCYCLVQNGIVDIKRHEVFIQDFLNKELVKTGDKSFYFITFTAAINFLISIAEDDPVKKLLNLSQ